MAKSKQNRESISGEEYTTNKVLAVFSICLAGVLVLMGLQWLLSRGSFWRTGMVAVRVLLGVGTVGALAGIFLLTQERSGKRTAVNRLVCGRNLLIVSVFLLLAMGAVYLYGTVPIKGMYVALPALAVYYLIYHSYSPEFFVIAADCGVAISLMWLTQRAAASGHFRILALIAPIAAIVLAGAQLAFVTVLRGRQGKFQFRGRKIQARFSRNAYTILCVTPVFLAFLTIAVRLLPTRFLLFLAAAAAYLFVTAVYYTVKLM